MKSDVMLAAYRKAVGCLNQQLMYLADNYHYRIITVSPTGVYLFVTPIPAASNKFFLLSCTLRLFKALFCHLHLL